MTNDEIKQRVATMQVMSWNNACTFARSPEQLAHAGFKTLEQFVLYERARIEKWLQKEEAKL